MTLGRQIFESTMGKVLLPLINLGFTGMVCTLASEVIETLRANLSA
jgi:hypothetical protein